MGQKCSKDSCHEGKQICASSHSTVVLIKVAASITNSFMSIHVPVVFNTLSFFLLKLAYFGHEMTCECNNPT